jgi:hypothetical protein
LGHWRRWRGSRIGAVFALRPRSSKEPRNEPDGGRPAPEHPGRSHTTRDHHLAVGAASAVGVLALVTRLPAAFRYSLWEDEVASARIIVQRSPVGFIRRVVGTESIPPVWYAIGWAAHMLYVPVLDVRLVSVLSGALLAALVVLYAHRFLPLPGATFAGVLAAVGWQFFRHGWELRPYALFALVSFAFVVLLYDAALRPTKGRFVSLAVCVAVGALTHYFFLFTLAAGLTWLLSAAELRPVRRSVYGAFAVGLVPFFIWLPAFVYQYRHGKFWWIGPFREETVAYIYGSLFDRSIDQANVSSRDALIAAALLTLVLAGSVRLWRSSLEGRLCACAALLPVLLSASIWRLGPHIFAARNLIGAAPFACVAIGSTFSFTPRRVGAALAAIGAALACVSYYNSRAGPPDYESVARALAEEGWHTGDPILIFGPAPAYLHPLDWYLPGKPRLAIAQPRTSGRCNFVYVVSVGGRARALARRASVPPKRINRILVARLQWSSSIWAELSLRDGEIAASSRKVPPCVRLPS